MRVKTIIATGIAILLLFGVSPAWIEGQPLAGEKEVKDSHPEVPRISAREVRRLYEEGKVLLVNAQGRDGQKKTMLVGSIGAPSGLINGSLIKIPEDLIVVFYCV